VRPQPISGSSSLGTSWAQSGRGAMGLLISKKKKRGGGGMQHLGKEDLGVVLVRAQTNASNVG
jgi:hypothetical protein